MDPHAQIKFAECLDALSSPIRLQMLAILRRPRTLREIEVRSARSGATISRQGVRRHLDQLLAAGAIATRGGAREYGDATEFVINHQRIFALSEELRALALMRPVIEPGGETVQGGAAPLLRSTGPLLLLVKGLDEGTSFDLHPRDRTDSWVIGRSRSVAISLDFDPTISHENALVTFREGAYWLSDLAGSRNGTTHNYRRLPEGENVRLAHGDVVGAGCSLLLFWQ